MKLKTFLAVAAIATFAACGTTYKATDTGVIVVSDDTRNAFVAQYPTSSNVVWSNYDANVVPIHDWELAEWPLLDATDYVVKFNMNNANYYAWYDSDGTWIGTTYAISDFTTLPSVVNTTLTRQYPAYTITSVNREFQKDRMAYEIVMKKDDGKIVLLVDNVGNIIKSKTKM